MKPKKLWTPDGISIHLDDDGDLVSESLFGFRTKPGKTPIDDLIVAVENSWMEWNIDDPKFVKLATKILGSIPDKSKFIEMIKASSQSEELKNALIDKLKVPDATTAANRFWPFLVPSFVTANQKIKWKPHRLSDKSKYLGSGSVMFKRSGKILNFDECCGPLPVRLASGRSPLVGVGVAPPSTPFPGLHYWEFINIGPWKYTNSQTKYPDRVHTKYVMVGNVWPNVNSQGMRRGTYVVANKATVKTALINNITSLIIKGKTII